jgi:hypothetical protein
MYIKGSSRYSIKVWEWQQIMSLPWPHFICHNLPVMIDHRLVIVCVCWTWMFLEAIESAATLDLIAMEWPHYCPLCWVHSLAHQRWAHPTPYPLCWVCHLAHKNGLAWHLITQHNGHGLVDHSIAPKRRKVEDGEQFGSSSELEFFKVLLTPLQFVLGLCVLLGFTAMRSNSLTKVKWW